MDCKSWDNDRCVLRALLTCMEKGFGKHAKGIRQMENSKVKCTAVMLAAGMGLRMGGDVRKQYLMLDTMPMFLHSAMYSATLVLLSRIEVSSAAMYSCG